MNDATTPPDFTERRYSGELWVDEDGTANFKWHIGGGFFADARSVLVKFIECLTHRLQNEESCPFYTAPEQVGALLDAWELLPNDVKSDLGRDFPSFVKAMTNLMRTTTK